MLKIYVIYFNNLSRKKKRCNKNKSIARTIVNNNTEKLKMFCLLQEEPFLRKFRKMQKNKNKMLSVL